jgi:hypothetical protein
MNAMSRDRDWPLNYFLETNRLACARGEARLRFNFNRFSQEDFEITRCGMRS